MRMNLDEYLNGGLYRCDICGNIKRGAKTKCEHCSHKKTIKVIDLLNMIANGEELPNKFKWGCHNFTWCVYTYKALDEFGSPSFFDIIKDCSYHVLNDEIEIVDELEETEDLPKISKEQEKNNKIEKLKFDDVVLFRNGQDIVDMLKIHAIKINEIIDKINEMRNKND